MKELLLLTLLSLLLLATSGDRINALKFGETDKDYILYQHNMQPFETGFTVCAWIRKLKSSDIPTWFSYAVSDQAHEIEITDMGDRTDIFGERSDLKSLYTVTPGTWFHNCLGWDATSQTRNVYINGALVDSEATPAGRTLKQGGYLVLGNEQHGPGTGMDDYNMFSGEMFKLNMFSKKLSDHDIKEMATDMCSVVEETHGEVRGIKWEDLPSAGCSLKVRAELKKLCNRAVHICKVIKLLSLVVCCAFPWCMIESASYFKKLILTLSQLFKVLHY